MRSVDYPNKELGPSFSTETSGFLNDAAGSRLRVPDVCGAKAAVVLQHVLTSLSVCPIPI